MSETGQSPPQRLPHTNPNSTAAPRPVASPTGAPRAPIQPPPPQRLPGQPGHAPQSQPQPLRPAPAGPSGRSGSPPPLPAGGRAPVPASIPLEDEGDLINLDDDDAAAPAPAAGGGTATGAAAGGAVPIGQISTTSKIKISAGGDKHTYTRFKRNTHVAGTGACRVRTFHGRLSDDGLAYTDDKINEWLDNHPEVEIKHVNCLVGPLEGKVTGEQGLIVVIWY